MNLPFSTDEFLNVFKSYNQSIFPLQIIFNIIALSGLYLIIKGSKNKNKIISLSLSFFWLWIGLVYQIIFFSSINKAAYLFGALFIIQGLLFFYYGIIKDKIEYEYRNSAANYVGIIFIAYAMMIYPLIGYFNGHQYPYAPTFGLPCPTTIFTFGILLFVDKKIPLLVLIIPLIWSIIGFSAAMKLSIHEDLGLLITGILGFTLLAFPNRMSTSQKII